MTLIHREYPVSHTVPASSESQHVVTAPERMHLAVPVISSPNAISWTSDNPLSRTAVLYYGFTHSPQTLDELGVASLFGSSTSPAMGSNYSAAYPFQMQNPVSHTVPASASSESQHVVTAPDRIHLAVTAISSLNPVPWASDNLLSRTAVLHYGSTHNELIPDGVSFGPFDSVSMGSDYSSSYTVRNLYNSLNPTDQQEPASRLV
ncbi:hypothetical protein DFH29DRAFT_1016226 [Suillus ampliporus]|nr:hypothetical protein DFH29DRAFT_1016226 [Suillus ampliporus]